MNINNLGTVTHNTIVHNNNDENKWFDHEK